MSIISKRSFKKFYLPVIGLPLLYTGIIAIMLNGSIKKAGAGGLQLSDYMFDLVLATALCSLGIYFIYRYFKNIPSITLDNEFITFGTEIFALMDIEKISLSGKKSFKFLFDYPKEGVSLTFKNGVIKYIFDGMYANGWAMKLFLKTVVVDKKEFIRHDLAEIDEHKVSCDTYDTFKGKVLTSLNGIMFWFIMGFAWISFFTNGKTKDYKFQISNFKRLYPYKYILVSIGFLNYLVFWLFNYVVLFQGF